MPTPDAQTPLERCPHCGSDARIAPHPIFRFACKVCGKPRLPLDGQQAKTDPKTAQLLATAGQRRMAKVLWQFASLGAFSTSFGVGLVGLGLSRWLDFAALGNGVVGALTLLPLTLGVLFWTQSKKALRACTAAIASAWQSAVQQLFAQRNGQLTADELARLLGVDLEQATLLLAEAEVSAWIAPGAGERMRVDESSELGSDTLEAETDKRRQHDRQL
jgi:ribosomal protein S27E